LILQNKKKIELRKLNTKFRGKFLIHSSKIPDKEAMEKYGTDRPDLRKDKEDNNLLAFCWVVDFPFFEKVSDSDNPQAQGEWTFTHNPFSAPQDNWMDSFNG